MKSGSLTVGTWRFMLSFILITQLCPTLCDPMDCKAPDSSVRVILERAAIPFSKGSSQLRNQTQISCAARFFNVWATREAICMGSKVATYTD